MAVGAAFDAQSDYHAYDVGRRVCRLSARRRSCHRANRYRIDGGDTFETLPKQNVVLLDLGYFLRDLRLTPLFQFTRRAVVDTTIGDETRWSIGVNSWWAGHNDNIKGAYGRINPRGLADQN